MKLEDKSMKELLELHNSIADAPAGPKTFSTKAKLLARLRALAEAHGIDLEKTAMPDAPQASATGAQADTPERAAEPAAAQKEPKKRGSGIGELARVLLMDPVGYPHHVIAAMVNAQIPGATATDKSVRWYGAKMRKEGIEVPPRAKHFGPNLDEEQSAKYLSTVTVVQGASQ